MKKFIPALLALALSACATAPTQQQIPVYDYPSFDHIKNHLETGLHFRTLKEVNDYVNSVPFKTDLQNYGVSDYWATPREFFKRNAGDCEDYVVAKYGIMLENGLITLQDSHIYLVSDMWKGNVPHALLVVNGMVYDNQNSQAVSFGEAQERYKFLVEVKK